MSAVSRATIDAAMGGMSLEGYVARYIVPRQRHQLDDHVGAEVVRQPLRAPGITA